MESHIHKDFFSRLNEEFNQIITSKILTVWEPEIKFIPGVRIGQARYISTKLKNSSDDTFFQFPNKYGRHTTLTGICLFLEKDHTKEYLITAYGKRKGDKKTSPAQFIGMHISHGSSSQVQFSPQNTSYLQKYINNVKGAEVLICHNHPQNIVTALLSKLIDWSPLPSNTDRETTFQFRYKAFCHWLSTGILSNFRFYLVEDGRLREISLPPATRILAMLNSIISCVEKS